jgi:hypothetical protein
MKMKARIAWLIVLALLAAACLLASVLWARMELAGLSKQTMERFEYLAQYWLIAFAILAGAWIVLLIKTIRYNPHDQIAEEP